jgi:hypothetical protein
MKPRRSDQQRYGNARYHLDKTHHILVRENSKCQDRRQLAIGNAFARTAVNGLPQARESEMNTLRGVINIDAFRDPQMLL